MAHVLLRRIGSAELRRFFAAIAQDRIAPASVALYAALLDLDR